MYLQANAFNMPIKSESVDLVIADPPFGIKFNGKSGAYNRKKTISDYFEFDGQRDADIVIGEIFRVLKPTGTFWLIMGWNSLSWWQLACGKYFPNMLGQVIWNYPFGVYAKKRPVTSHYNLLIYTKNKKKWTWNQQGYDESVWYIKRKYRFNQLKYPTRLPDELIKNIIIRSSNEGDTIYDPFVGSGTTVKVGREINRIAFGSDILNNKEFWKI